MTKILYIPTGEYLKYYGNNDILFTSLTKEDVEIEIEELLFWEYTNTSVFSSWVLMNNIILPILRSELEIIEDD